MGRVVAIAAERISAFRPFAAEAFKDRSFGAILGLSVCRIWVYTFFLALGESALARLACGGVNVGSALYFGAGGLLALALAFGARWVAPRLQRFTRFGLVALGVASAILACWVRFMPSEWIVLPAVLCGGLVIAVLRVSWGCVCGCLEPRLAGLYTAFSFLVAVAVSALLKVLPSGVSLVMLFVLPVVGSVLLGRAFALPVCSGAAATEPRNAQALRAFWPLAVSMFVFVAASAALRSLLGGDASAAWVSNWWTTVVDGVVAVLFCFIYLFFKRMDPIPVYRCVIPLLVVGYAVFPLLPGEHRVVGSMLAAVGYGLVDLLSWVVMAKFVHDGRGMPLHVFGFGVGVTLVGRALGTVVGGVCEALQVQGVVDLSSISLVMTVVLVLVCVLILPEGVFMRVSRTADSKEDRGVSAGLERLHAACRELAAQGGLTPRETDVLLLLARGRNAQAIARELQIASGTVQTHIKHIYSKTDLHTQQELIDRVEALVAVRGATPDGGLGW